MPVRIAGPAAPRCAGRMVASRPREKELLMTAMSPDGVGAVLLKDPAVFIKFISVCLGCAVKLRVLRPQEPYAARC